MGSVKKILFLVLASLLLASCAKKVKKIRPSTYLFGTERQSKMLISDLKSALEAEQYEVRAYEENLGIITTNDKYFSVSGDIEARHNLQIRQEGGSVKVRIKYECNYTGNFQACIKSDPQTYDTISAMEPGLVSKIVEVTEKKDITAKSQIIEGLAEDQ